MSRVRVPEGVPYGPLVKWPKTPASHAGNMGSNPVRVTNARIVRIKQNRKYIFGKTESVCKLVFIVMRVHPFPFRTRKLSSSTPKILCGRLHGKIGRCQHLYSSIAQSVERMTVNHDVTGSSPVGGATTEAHSFSMSLCFINN